MTISKKHRISANQRAILAAIANLIINTYSDFDQEIDVEFVSYSKVRDECRHLWSDNAVRLPWDTKVKTIKASFSRAVGSLIDAGLVDGLALAWVLVENRNLRDFWRWQGGSRRPDSELDGDPSPKIKMLALTSAGWVFVEKERKREERRRRKLERQASHEKEGTA